MSKIMTTTTKTVMVGHRMYAEERVSHFTAIIKSVSLVERSEERQKAIDAKYNQILQANGVEAANKYLARLPKFKIAVNLEGMPVKGWDSVDSKIANTNVLFLYDYDVRAALGSNVIIREMFNKDIYVKHEFDSLIGCEISGTQIAVPADTEVCSPYAGVHANAWKYTKHADIINVIDGIKLIPYGKYNPFAAKTAICDYAAKMCSDVNATLDEIMMILDKTESIKYLDDTCRDMTSTAVANELGKTVSNMSMTDSGAILKSLLDTGIPVDAAIKLMEAKGVL